MRPRRDSCTSPSIDMMHLRHSKTWSTSYQRCVRHCREALEPWPPGKPMGRGTVKVVPGPQSIGLWSRTDLCPATSHATSVAVVVDSQTLPGPAAGRHPGALRPLHSFMRGPDGSRPGPTPLSVPVEKVASDAGGRDGSPTAGASGLRRAGAAVAAPGPAGHADAGRAAAAAGARRDAPGAGIAGGHGDERSFFQNRPPPCHSYQATVPILPTIRARRPRGGAGGPCPRLARPLLVVRGRAASRRKPHRRVLRPPRRGPSSCRPGLTRRTSRSPPGSRHSLAKTPCRGTSKKPGGSVASGPCPRGGRNLEDLVNGFGAWRTVFDKPRSDPLRVARRDPGTSVPSGPSSGPRQPGARESRRPSDSHLIPDRKGVARWTSRTRSFPPSSPWSGTDPTPACRSSRRDAPPATPTTSCASSPIRAPRCPATSWTS